MRSWLLGLGLLTAAATPGLADPPQTTPLRASAEAVRDHALEDHTAYDYIESLSVDVGERLAGSEATPRATAWALAKLTALGFSNVHTEPFPITAWLRGPEEAEIIAPHPQKLAVIGEAAGRISDELTGRHSQIPWRQIVAFRNILIHAYFGIDWNEVWKSAKVDCPVLRGQVAGILTAEFGESAGEGGN